MNPQQELDLLTDVEIEVNHRIEFKGSININDTVIMEQILELLIMNDYKNIKHIIYLKNNQKHLMKNNPRFERFCHRIKQYFKKFDSLIKLI